jgi:hypothetical protein
MEGVDFDLIKSTAEPGEKLQYKINTSLKGVWMVQDKIYYKKSKERIYETLNEQGKYYEQNVSEEDRGGHTINWMFVKHNRFYSGSETFSIPFTNKELSISYETFRDKILPGSNEKWKIKIKGAKADKVAAEMLVSMYDASLDQFKGHKWNKPNIYEPLIAFNAWQSLRSFSVEYVYTYDLYKKEEINHVSKQYDQFVFGKTGEYNEFLYNIYSWNFGFGDISNPRLMRLPNPVLQSDEDVMADFKVESTFLSANAPPFRGNYKKGEVNQNLDADGLTEVVISEEEKKPDPPDQLQIRKNFNETAFFFPDLKTNENGEIEFSFTMPEALTRWKLQALTHTKELAFGYSSKEIVTQKQLMVQPNPPRFLREGDRMEFSAKIVNLTEKELTGQAELQLFDAATNESVSGWFNNMYPNQYFTVAAGQSEAVVFPIQVPYLFDKALVWRIVARAGDVSDGEEAAMPVLTNRMLVTETLPLNLRNAQTKNFRFEKLLTSGNSETLQHHSVTVEYTSNPAWYAVQALPYLMEYPYECAEQTWNRYYANALASKIANASPRIKEIFTSWNIKDTAALLSNLQKNQELKSVLLEETPWVLEAKTEAQQKKNIALLFDMVRMSNEMNSEYEKLKQMQNENGGFVWFKGGQIIVISRNILLLVSVI